MASETSAQRRVSGQMVMDAIIDLHNMEQVVTKEVVAEKTGIKMSTLEWHFDALVADERIRRVRAGVYVPIVASRPARPITRSVLTDGTSVLEIGERVEILTPREARMLGELFHGSANHYASIQLSAEVGIANAHNDVLLKEARLRIESLEAQIKAKPTAKRANPPR